MALQDPLILDSGNIKPLPGGDTLIGLQNAGNIIRTYSNDAGPGNFLNRCQHVIARTNGTQVFPSGVPSSSSSGVKGLVVDVISAHGATVDIMVDGIFSASTAEWDVYTGDTGGLVAGKYYYTDTATPGNLKETDLSGQRIGQAISSTELVLQPFGQPA